MNKVEQWCSKVRHHPSIERADWLWKRLNPLYLSLQGWLPRDFWDITRGCGSVRRRFNGGDVIRVLKPYRFYKEDYEPEVWGPLMQQVRAGDVVADVGAYIGLYTVALARRVGRGGQVLAFEPSAQNFAVLRQHLKLNYVSRRVRLLQAAAGARSGSASLLPGPDPTQFHLSASQGEAKGQTAGDEVRVVALDDLIGAGRLDILKIDVEGHEEQVLLGAQSLLRSSQGPRLIYIEVHPYAWEPLGTTSESLLGRLTEAGYHVTTETGKPVGHIDSYGEIMAVRRTTV